jgi:4-amino-4-deoxy-L-arabinose transferase-like glycosyltransferase
LPFLFSAAIAAPWTDRLFGIRFAALLAAQVVVVLVFWIGMRFFDPLIAVVAVALVSFNAYSSQLVHGTQFSGIPDLTLACCLLGALYALLFITERGRRRDYVVFGVCVGTGFLCKDGLALIPFVVLIIAAFARGGRQQLQYCGIAVIAALLVMAPSSLYLAVSFPSEALLEQQERIDHLLRDLDGWGRPFDFYWTVYFPSVTSPLISGLAYVAVGWGLVLGRRDAKLAVMSLWVLSYLVVLSSGVSKVHNFIYPIVPVVYLLIPAVVHRLWREQHYGWMMASAATVAGTAVLLQWNLLDSSMWVVKRPTPAVRPLLLVFQAATLMIVLAICHSLRLARLRAPSAAASGLSIAIVLWASIHAMWEGAYRRGADQREQMLVRDASLALRRTLSHDDLVLVRWPSLRKSHLYVQYWSGHDSFEVTAAQPLDVMLKQLRARRVYLLSDHPIGHSSTRVSDAGYVMTVR